MIRASYTVWCDDCGDPLDDGDIGTRTRQQAIDGARRKHGMVRRKLIDGWAELCGECADQRCGSTSRARQRGGS